MSERDPESYGSPESQLMDALLRHALAPKTEADGDELRIQQLMTSLRTDSEQNQNQPPDKSLVSPVRQPFAVLRRWIIIPTTSVALLFLLLLLPSFISKQQAWATVERSLAAERKPLVRQYQVTLTTQAGRADHQPFVFDLFVRQQSFVIRAPALTGEGVVWMGGNDHERWIVPRRGPVLTGRQGLLGRWTRRRRAMATPFLRTADILERLQRFYDLEMQPRTQLPGFEPNERAVDCDHVIAIRQQTAPTMTIPSRVELWADCELGFTRRMAMEWDQPADFAGLTSAVVQLTGTPDVAPEFFSHRAHHDADRKVIRGETDAPAENEPDG